MNSRRFRYALLFALALTEVLPIALLSQALPVLMRRSGASMQQIGVLFLAMLPWSLKALWAPLIDRLGARSTFGRYRGWLLFAHPLILITLIAGSFFDIPELLLHHRAAATAALLWLTTACALADAASHGLAVSLLSAEERGFGNGLQTAGLMAGQLVGGGLMVILVGRLGWQPALLIISALLLLPLPGIALYKERPVDPSRIITPREVLAFFRQPRMGRWLLVVAAMPIGVSLMTPALEVMLVDRGLSLKEIGLAMGILSGIAGAAGGLLGGAAVKRLGRERSFYALSVFCSLCLALVLLHRVAVERAFLYFVISVPVVGIMARATMIHVLMMDRSRLHVASTDFTIQYTVQHVSRVLWASAGAFVAGHLGATSVFVLAPVLTLAAMGLAARLLDRADFEPPLSLDEGGPGRKDEAAPAAPLRSAS
ncbi:MFS transporter [Sorangium sp. So ce1151]|uniref:MFS transporter n=1 Tax=Sorangium sp. So ce1151 TaxID=3133332 RepID=UPI003F5DB3C3